MGLNNNWYMLWYDMGEPLPTTLTTALERYAAKHGGRPVEIRACAATLNGNEKFDGIQLVIDERMGPGYYKLMLPDAPANAVAVVSKLGAHLEEVGDGNAQR